MLMLGKGFAGVEIFCCKTSLLRGKNGYFCGCRYRTRNKDLVQNN